MEDHAGREVGARGDTVGHGRGAVREAQELGHNDVVLGRLVNERATVWEGARAAEEGHVVSFVVEARHHFSADGVDPDAPVAVVHGARGRKDGLQLEGVLDLDPARAVRDARVDAVRVRAVLGSVEHGALVVEGGGGVEHVDVDESVELVVDVA